MAPKKQAEIGVIGGTGLYEIEGLEALEIVRAETPFGAPSDEIVLGTFKGRQMAFLPRHGKGHRLLPSEVNYRANIFALKQLGVSAIIAVSAVGSMKKEIVPGDIVVPDQYIDRTRGRANTFFGGGIVGHIQFADPVCPQVSRVLAECSREAGARVHEKGVYVCMEGPAFSTRAESLLYRSWGVDVIGMTNLPEAKLAREAEICYATLAFSTDYDCWNEEHCDVHIEDVLRIIKQNVELSKRVIALAAERLPAVRGCGCSQALEYAIITDRKLIPDRIKRELAPIIGRVIK